MGPCMSSLSAEEKAALEKSRNIDRDNSRDYRSQMGVIKLLLLGYSLNLHYSIEYQVY